MCPAWSCNIRARRGLTCGSASKSDVHQVLVLTFIQCASAHVEAEVWLRADLFTPLHELVCAKFVGLHAQPGELWSDGCQSLHMHVKHFTRGAKKKKFRVPRKGCDATFSGAALVDQHHQASGRWQ